MTKYSLLVKLEEMRKVLKIVVARNIQLQNTVEALREENQMYILRALDGDGNYVTRSLSKNK